MESAMIREYQQADWPRLMAIHDAARMSELEHAGLTEAFVPLEICVQSEGLFDYTVRVAEVDGNVVGFVAYSEDELAWLYVDPAMKHRGIGRALVRYTIENVKKRPLHVELLVGNEPALRLYESMGFVLRETATGAMPGNESFTVSAHQLSLE